LIEFFLKGGLIMWPILALSVVSLSIIMERLYNFHRARLNLSQFLSKIENYLKKGEIEKALNYRLLTFHTKKLLKSILT